MKKLMAIALICASIFTVFGCKKTQKGDNSLVELKQRGKFEVVEEEKYWYDSC